MNQAMRVWSMSPRALYSQPMTIRKCGHWEQEKLFPLPTLFDARCSFPGERIKREDE